MHHSKSIHILKVTAWHKLGFSITNLNQVVETEKAGLVP